MNWLPGCSSGVSATCVEFFRVGAVNSSSRLGVAAAAKVAILVPLTSNGTSVRMSRLTVFSVGSFSSTARTYPSRPRCRAVITRKFQ